MFPELTVVEIARRVGAPLHRVECVLWTRPHVRPPVRSGKCKSIRSEICNSSPASCGGSTPRRGGSLQGVSNERQSQG